MVGQIVILEFFFRLASVDELDVFVDAVDVFHVGCLVKVNIMV